MCSAYNDPTEEAVSSELEAVASARRKREVVGATEARICAFLATNSSRSLHISDDKLLEEFPHPEG